jgi:hypothetical protein
MSEPRLAAYQAFVAAEHVAREGDGYLFDVPRCRFALEPADELRLAPGTTLQRDGATAKLVLPVAAELAISGIPFELLQKAVRELPCTYSRLVITLGTACPSFLEQTFSKLLFAPRAVAELEVDVPSVEIVRFPGSPYEVVRSYWRNAIAVRRELEARALPETPAELRALITELHELMLLGAPDDPGRSSFYLPASLLGRKRPEPGRFYEEPSRFERRGAETILTSGARVAVPLLGGLLYWQLLAESVNDDGALADEREIATGDVPLGRIVLARAEDEPQAKPWFLPPRPLLDAHFEELLHSLTQAHVAARAQEPELAVKALSRFHYRFVRVHPLPSANQSLSMSFVNVVLRRLFGVGMPHLLLDQLALRFTPGAYEQLFARAARAWITPFPSPAERLRHLVRNRQALDAFVSEVTDAPSRLEARALIAENPVGAHLSLLSDSAA